MHSADAGREFASEHRFDDVIIRSDIERRDAGCLLVGGGNDDHPTARLSERLHQSEAVHIRQCKVDQHDIRLEELTSGEGRLTGRDAFNVHPGVAQSRLDECRNRADILHHQHTHS